MRQIVQLVIGGIVVLVLLVALTRPEPPRPTSTPEPAEAVAPDPEEKIREAIERTKGDYAKLTDEEKSRMDGITSGHGKEFFALRVRQWKQGIDPKAIPAVENKSKNKSDNKTNK